MFNRHRTSLVAGQSSPLPTTLLTEPKPEQVVKDQVKTRPVRDQYAALTEASRRLDAGKSVFLETTQKHPEPA
ncbi:MAG: hypothetical protein ACO1OR_12255 [Hydrogenophaga sp.]